MSKLSDYSKFDHLDSSDEDESSTDDCGDVSRSAPNAPTAEEVARPQPAQPTKMGVTKKGSEIGRYVFEHNGRKVYEWEQSLEEITIYVDAPLNVVASQLICTIQPDRLQLGIRQSDRFFIDEMTYSKVNTTESSWYLSDGIIHIVLAKVFRGETWESALRGRKGQDGTEEGLVDPFTKQQMQKDLMIERFQEENPGFDFRGAEFNGEAPDPRTFLGGVKYS